MATETVLPGMGLSYDWDLGNDTWKTGMDANLFMLNFLSNLTAISISTGQPGVPSDGDMYLLGDSPAGAAWTGNGQKIAVFYGGTWYFYTPIPGWRCFDQNQGQYVTFSGGEWKLPGALYTQYADDAAAAAGTPAVPIGGVYINSTSKALVVRTA